jgi:AraC-like DNA-binding protein
MSRPHKHDELELNIVLDGRLEYLFGGSRITVEAGEIALFWAATPHRLIGDQRDECSDVCWAHIPLDLVFSWALPDHDLSEILMNRMIILSAEAGGKYVEATFDSWTRDIGAEETVTIALLEVQALVRRLLQQYRLRTTSTSGESPRTVIAPGDGMSRVTAMALFIVTNFRDPISPAEIAEASHLNPNYAMTLFRETVGTTLGGYLTRCRVAEAQRLLITTSMTTAEIAYAAGFGSQSSFYTHFLRTCGSSPGAYRRRLR